MSTRGLVRPGAQEVLTGGLVQPGAQEVLVGFELIGENERVWHVVVVLRAVLVHHPGEAGPQVGFECERRCTRELVDALVELEEA